MAWAKRCARLLGEQHHAITDARHPLISLQTRAQRQQRELTRPVGEGATNPLPGHDVHRSRRRVDGDEHRGLRSVQTCMHRNDRLTTFV